jgi:S1-C subfamily serine protease
VLWRLLAACLLPAVALAQSAPSGGRTARAETPAAPATGTAALSATAREAIARARPSVVQIKGFFGGNSAQAFHGTGFAVAPGGVLLTNYHVVAEQVLHPEKIRLEYRTTEGKTGTITVLAIDVRHDLAVVRADGFDGPPLALNGTVPAKGERAYSIGFPLDVGLTITEGVSNGRVEDSFDPRIHYSGAINGGMSGGPAVNAAGQVIGINVSGYRFRQLVSFLVPASHARALIDRARTQPLEPKEARNEVTAQLHAHAGALLGALDSARATQNSAGYALPAKLSQFIDCSAGGDTSTDQPVQITRVNCAAKAGLYVQEGLYTGDLRFSHFVMTSDKLDAWRFAYRLSKLSQASGAFGSRKHVGPFACRDSVVKLAGFDAALMVCARSYRKLEGLYDFTVRVTSLNEATRGFVSHLDMYGMEYDAGLRFVRQYVETMQWKP